MSAAVAAADNDANITQGQSEIPLPNLREEDKEKWTLVLDINETIAHAEDEGGFLGNVKPDITVAADGICIEVVYRPHVTEFLRDVSTKFEIVLWGSGHPIYVNAVADGLDKNRDYIRWRLSGFSLSKFPKDKDLSVLGRDLRRTIIIDNNRGYMYKHPENGIVCREFNAYAHELQHDEELLTLRDFLMSIPGDTADLRPILRRWKRSNNREPLPPGSSSPCKSQ